MEREKTETAEREISVASVSSADSFQVVPDDHLVLILHLVEIAMEVPS